MYQCKKCQSQSYTKSGSVKGEQRYKCRLCGCQFVPTREGKGMTAGQKALALCLYINGLSFRTIGKIIRIDHVAVYRYIRNHSEQIYEKPEPCDEPIIMLELDEMWHFLQSKKQKYGYGKHFVVIPVNSSTGSVEDEILIHLSGSLKES